MAQNNINKIPAKTETLGSDSVNELIGILNLSREEVNFILKGTTKHVDVFIDIFKAIIVISFPALISSLTIHSDFINLTYLKIISVISIIFSIIVILILLYLRNKIVKTLLKNSSSRLKVISEIIRHWLLKQKKS